MKVLFITSNRLGDAVLSTGLLDHIIRTHPEARITVACGALPASLFEGMPQLEHVIILKKQCFNLHWLKLWMKVIGIRWDMVVDLRDSIVSRTVWARQWFIHTKREGHKVEQNAAVMGIDPPPAPVIWVSERQEAAARVLVPEGGPVLAVGPTANWIGKTWPAERFIELIEKLTAADGILPGALVAVFAAPGEETAARFVLESVPSPRRIDMIAKADPGTAAAALRRCSLYIGNDSGLMHCAAAAGIPTVGLFGPSWPEVYRPWGEHAAYISTLETFDRLIDFPGYDPKTLKRSLMGTLEVWEVLRAVENSFPRPLGERVTQS